MSVEDVDNLKEDAQQKNGNKKQRTKMGPFIHPIGYAGEIRRRMALFGKARSNLTAVKAQNAKVCAPGPANSLSNWTLYLVGRMFGQLGPMHTSHNYTIIVHFFFYDRKKKKKNDDDDNNNNVQQIIIIMVGDDAM